MNSKLPLLKSIFLALILLPFYSLAEKIEPGSVRCEAVKKICVGDRVIKANNIFYITFGTVVKVLPEGKVAIVFDETTQAVEEDVSTIYRNRRTDCAGKICRGDRVLGYFGGQHWPGTVLAVYDDTIISTFLDHNEFVYSTSRRLVRIQDFSGKK